MNIDVLERILDVSRRKELYEPILSELKNLDGSDHFTTIFHETSEGIIPVVFFNKDISSNEIKAVKLFIGAQHNEYNGLFGILEVLKLLRNGEIPKQAIIDTHQVLVFLPLMNPYGFLNPRKDNKSGYYLKNGTNLNRFWRRVFILGFEGNETDLIEHPIPEHATFIKNLITPYWNNEEISIFIIDFHETSLLGRFPKELSLNLSVHYKFDHWLKESIIQNIIKLYDIKKNQTPLFIKCNNSADHSHLNLSYKLIEKVREKLFDYLSENQGKLPFYFVHSKKSKEPCEQVGMIVNNKLSNILWKTALPVHDHEFHDHGCLVRMNDAAERDNLYCIELENQKQFFNIFEEREKAKEDSEYYPKKLATINKTLELIKQTIIEVIYSVQ